VNKDCTIEVVEAVVNFMKIKMKNFKESNINLIKCILDLFNFMAVEISLMNKRMVSIAMPFYIDKIGNLYLSK